MVRKKKEEVVEEVVVEETVADEATEVTLEGVSVVEYNYDVDPNDPRTRSDR